MLIASSLIGCLRNRSFRHPLAQAFLINFVSAGERQLLKKKDAAWMLVGRTVGQSESLEIFFRRPRASAQHDKGVRHLPSHFMLDRHDERLAHGRKAFEQPLALYRQDGLAAAHD